MNIKSRFFVFCIFCLLICFSWTYFPLILARSTTGPFIVKPPWSIGAPNDNVEFVFNISDSEVNIDNVTLCYVILDIGEERPAKLDIYEHISMTLFSQENSVQSWYCTLMPKDNNKVIYFFVKISDSSGKIEYYPDFKNSLQFRILKPEPEFRITFFNIESINEKQLTADIKFSVDIVATYDQPTVSLYVNDQHFLIDRLNRFSYFKQILLRDIRLSGDPTDFPFDKYELDIKFKTFFESEPEIQFQNIMISDYNDRSIWTHSFESSTSKSEYSSIIEISNVIHRKIENSYYFIVPTLVCFFLLGSSYLLPGNSDNGLRNRLTITLTIFIFLTNSYRSSQILQNMIPDIAIGITVAEVTLTWVSAYSGIIILLSVLGFFFRDQKIKGYEYYIIFDLLSTISIVLLFFLLPIVNIASPYFTQQNTLWEHISFLPYKITLLFSMVFGWTLNTFKILKKK